MPGKELQHTSLLPGTLDSTNAREIEAEIKRAKHQCRMQSGKPDYPYWRKRLVTLLNAAKRYRPLTQHEQTRIDFEQQQGGDDLVVGHMFESFSDRLDHALFS